LSAIGGPQEPAKSQSAMPEDKKAPKEHFEYVPEVRPPEPKKVVTARLEYESLPSAEAGFETSLDTFQRLKNEVYALKSDLEQQKAEPYAAPSLGLDEMAVTIHTLSGGPSADTTAQGVLGQLASSKGQGNAINYSVYLNTSEQSPLLEMDRRVDRLCAVVGQPAQQTQSMFGQLRDLQARLELADDFKLDAVLRRTKSLVTEIDALETPDITAAVQTTQDKGAQLEKLRAVVAPLTPAAVDVPNVLNRLKTRKDTDEQAARVLLRLKRLQASHEAVTRMLLTDQQQLLKVGAQMVANSKIMTGNLENLQQRLKVL